MGASVAKNAMDAEAAASFAVGIIIIAPTPSKIIAPPLEQSVMSASPPLRSSSLSPLLTAVAKDAMDAEASFVVGIIIIAPMPRRRPPPPLIDVVGRGVVDGGVVDQAVAKNAMDAEAAASFIVGIIIIAPTPPKIIAPLNAMSLGSVSLIPFIAPARFFISLPVKVVEVRSVMVGWFMRIVCHQIVRIKEITEYLRL